MILRKSTVTFTVVREDEAEGSDSNLSLVVLPLGHSCVIYGLGRDEERARETKVALLLIYFIYCKTCKGHIYTQICHDSTWVCLLLTVLHNRHILSSMKSVCRN